MYAINHSGLTKKQTYEDIIEDVIGRKAKIKYPNRDAKILRESPTIINLLDLNGNSGLAEMDRFNKKQIITNEIASTIREMSENGLGSVEEIRSSRHKITGDGHSVLAQVYPMDADDESDELYASISS